MSATTEILKTERAIAFVKDHFEKALSNRLNLIKVSSPIAVMENTGLNDELNGVERPVNFMVKSANGSPAVIVHSLAKWKRLRLKELDIAPGMGVLTDMRALRPEEDYTPLHSIYVDQWDWEQCMLPEERRLSFLKATVKRIYEALKETEKLFCEAFTSFSPTLADQITFIHAEELVQRYPDLTPKQRETEIARECGSVFIIGIGAELSDGLSHDGRAPDYDDWSSENEEGSIGLNGDIIVWNHVLQDAFEISSMGIRVDPEALQRQLVLRRCPEKAKYPFHQMLLGGELPQSIGGGIGQSRVCMFMLRKSHIGEVQVGIWPEGEKERLEGKGIRLL